jgi:hypothetical protein
MMILLTVGALGKLSTRRMGFETSTYRRRETLACKADISRVLSNISVICNLI